MDANLKAFLGSQLRSFRRDAKLTQEELGDQVGRTAEAISNIERGKNLPTLETLIALAEALEIPLRDFFPTGSFDPDTSPNRLKLEAEVATLVRGLSNSQLRVAQQQIKALAGL